MSDRRFDGSPTAQDVVAYLLAATGGGAQDGEHAAVRQAVIQGVREVMQCRNWNWHLRTGSFTTRQTTTTGTVTAGSANITVASATDFVPGRILAVSENVFPTPVRIVSVNANVVTVDVPATKSASGVTLRPQIYYDMPRGLKDIDALITNTVGTLHCYITPQEWQRLEVNTRGVGEPYYYTIMRTDVVAGTSTAPRGANWQIRFVGVPNAGTVVHYTYRQRPAPVKYMGYERICRQGTVSVTGTTVTGEGTAFPLDAGEQGTDTRGAIIRFGQPGMPAEASGSTIPWVRMNRVASVQSATQLTLITGASSGIPAKTQYAITDEIDASQSMYTAILSACEMWYARIAGKPAESAMAVFNRDLRIAMENDVISPMSGRPYDTPYPTPRSMGWHSELMPDLE